MDFTSILLYIDEQFAFFGAWVTGALFSLYEWAVSALQFIWDALVSLAQSLHDIFQSIREFFEDVWYEVIEPFIEWCQQIIDDITTWLANVLDPIITFVTKLMKWFRLYILPYLKIIIEVIQRMRVILALFKLLGAQWAAKLDADLAKIQGYVTLAIQDVVKTLNTISSVLNLVLDPAQIIRKDFFTGTLFSSLGAVKRAGAFGGNRALTASEAQSEADDGALLNGGAAVATRNADGTMTYSPALTRISAGFDDAIKYYGLPSGTP